MSERTWTADQDAAIHAKWRTSEKKDRQSLLVQAAAGSGKTAVLVERIIKKLIPDNGDEPESIGNLLAVTFTNAAAGEMRERIGAALSKELTRAIENRDLKTRNFLKKQLSLLPYADITTIDAFCLKAIRSHFHLLNIDPDFTITDSGEAGIMRSDAMDTLFEEMYESNNPDFLELICMYTDGRSDDELSEKINQIYEFTRSFPDPEAWLSEKCAEFLNPEACSHKNEGIKKARSLAKTGMEYLKSAAQIIVSSAGISTDNLEETMLSMPPHEPNDIYLAWGTYYTAVFDEYFNLKKISEADWDEIYSATKIRFVPLNTKADFVDKERQIKDKALRERVKSLRTLAVEKIMKKGIKKYISMPFSEFSQTLCPRLYKTACALSDMTLRFSEIYKSIKAEKNVMEFSDIEHLCLKLFRDFPDVKQEYSEKYSEILMDEYQDSNRLQEEIFRLISRGDNLFMVGDMKQSIYRFRSSDPTIFREKSESFQKDETARERKIVLSKNFRSREIVLESINDVFSSSMTRDCGDIDYNEEQRLNAGDPNYAEENPDYRSELLLIEETGGEEGDAVEKTRLEARVIASKINEMKSGGFLVRDTESVSFPDPKTGEIKKRSRTVYRPLRNKDITILMSSYKNVSGIYTEELSAAGIECYAESRGYFERSEIKLVMSLLKILANPYCDIPLLGVLRSPIGGFSDDDLVNIRLSGEGYIFSAMNALVKQFSEGSISDPEAILSAKKSAEFIQKLNKWRSYTQYMTSDKLLWTLYEETDIYSFVGALYGGDEAQANLRLLFERAKKYESTGYKGLFNFVRYVSLLKRKNEDLSSAAIVTQNHDVVRIMTIHASKGLEFPVVFLAGCGKKFNLRDTGGTVLLHRTLGFGLDFIDFENSVKIPNITKTVTADAIKRESISEEIRKMYVAMTRAKEKLIVTATAGKKTDGADKLEEKYSNTAECDPTSASCFLDWIMPAAMGSEKNWIYRRIPFAKAASGVIETIPDAAPCGEFRDISDFMTYKYPYEDSVDIPSKISVSDLKKRGLQETEKTTQMLPAPSFLQPQKSVFGAARGTVIHYVMQNIPLVENMDFDYVRRFVQQLADNSRLSTAEAECVDISAITNFFNSPIGIRMRKSKKIMREAPFEIQFPANIVNESFSADEQVIVQGVIDCYFEEDGEFVLIDYKSDRYKDPNDIKNKYITQIELYSHAIEKITEKKVKNKYLYLLFGNNVLEL